jgi:hypothetical protein
MAIGLISNSTQGTQLKATSAATSAGASASVSSANDQIRKDKQQLDDWTTCVSAKTTKGQAEIQRLSADLSGAENRAQRLAAQQTQAVAVAPTRSIDVWA